MTQQSNPRQQIKMANGSLINSHIAADNSAPVTWYPNQNKKVRSANTKIVSIILVSLISHNGYIIAALVFECMHNNYNLGIIVEGIFGTKISISVNRDALNCTLL